ncbi:MAG: 4'-phosphopantetheinyl transferase superfamily protein [Bacteroidota bacterium]|nr:4'-phosphopantetheinyl transferase superfamily protein [Bacteroidota bacterium]
MPLFFQQDIDANTKVAIWKIEEKAAFFLRDVLPQRAVSHPHKQLQHLAGRYLLRYLYPDFPVKLIQLADTSKPFLENEEYHFSISHCGDFAAAIVSKTNRVGVDIELASQKVEKIKHKFLSENENKILKAQLSTVNCQLSTMKYQLTLLWSCKEAVFKWYGLGGIDFIDHIRVKSITATDKDCFETIIDFKKKEKLYLNLTSKFFGDLCLSYVVT